MNRAVVVSRFDLSGSYLVKAGAMFENYRALVSQCEGFIGTSVWRQLADQEKFMRATVFETTEAYLTGYDWMVQSGGLETAIYRYGVLPDVQVFEVKWTHGRRLERALDHEFLSLSDRAMDTREVAADWVDKLKMNLRECDSIPGFDGCLIATGYELSQRVLALALWRSEQAFLESLPGQPDYAIPFYQRVR